MELDLEDFDFITCNFPPKPWVVEKIDGKVSCDLTSYDAPTLFDMDILLHSDLQVLRLFTDNICSIPNDIGNLKCLEELVLCHFESRTHSNLTQLPVTLKKLRNLRHLDVRRNPLLKFPSQLTSLVNLEELHVNDCKLSSLPDKLEQLQKLKILDLSNNDFQSLPRCVMKLQNLVRLYASDGKLETLCKEIGNLTKLERLQLTNNQLTLLPNELFDLVNLKKLHLNDNRLTSLSEKVNQLVNLEYLVLNGNKLTKLPNMMGNLNELCYLNLHENRLTRLPESLTNLTKLETMLVGNNPLQVPPVYVCNQGISSIRDYFKAMRNTCEIHSKRLKVVLLGESMAGKTSLVKALVEGEACEINKNDRTFGVVFYHWKPEPNVDELELLLVDCAGQRKYQMTHQLFLSEGALFILAVDLSCYQFDKPEIYHTILGEWITLVAARIPRARIMIVPTHVDKCQSQEEIEAKCQDIVTKVMEDRQEMVDKINKRLDRVLKTEGSCIPEEDRSKLCEEYKAKKDNLPVISLQYQGKSYDKICHSEADLSMNMLPVSNIGSLDGMIGLRKELVRIARNRELSPTVDRELPESWVKIEGAIKVLAQDLTIPCVSKIELEILLNEKNVNVCCSELDSCLMYLHAIGELLFFKDISGLEKKVVLNPYWLASILRKLFRHDLNEKLIYDVSYRKFGMVQFQFDQDKQQLFSSGILKERLLRCVWSDVPFDKISSQILIMLMHFGWACEMPPLTDDLDNDDDKPRYLVPWFLECKRPSTVERNWPYRPDKSQIEVSTGFGLLQYLPFGVFERFSVHCHGHDPCDFEHWQNGLYMKFGGVPVLGSVSHNKKCSTIKLTARAPERKLQNLWKTLLLLLQEVQKLLQEWPGMDYVRFTVCPMCIKDGVDSPYHFTCNWFNAHKLGKNRASCKKCGHDLDLNHVYPSNEVLKAFQNCDGKMNSLPEDGALSEEIVDNIAKMLGSSWPKLARKLGMGNEVDIIKSNYKDDTEEQAVQMFAKWKRKNGRSSKRSTICKALRELEYSEVAEYVETPL